MTRDDLRELPVDDECARFEPLLAAQALGRSSRDPGAARDMRALDMHLASCTACREVEATLGSIVDGLSGAMLELSSPASARTLSRLDAAAEVRPARSISARLLPFGTFAAGAAIAATIAVFATGSRGARVPNSVVGAPPIVSSTAEALRPAGGPCPPAPPASTPAPTDTAPPPPKAPEPNEIWVPRFNPPQTQDPFARDPHGWKMPPLPKAPDSQNAAPAANGFGTINVNCIPRCESIVVDGVPRGPSPLVGFRVPAGTHTVIGILNQRQHVLAVNLNEGGTQTVAIKGERDPLSIDF
jgi:hypothetical protein